MARGMLLYSRLWENKPPAIYLLYEGVYRWAGPSVVVIRLAAAAAVVLTVLLASRLAAYFKGEHAAVFAALLVGLIFGVPFLEGTTANAETFAAPLAAGAVYVGVVRDRALAAGLLVGCAVLFKSVGAFDGAALFVWLAVYRRHRVSLFVVGAVLPLAACVVAALSLGDFKAMLQDALLYDIGYVNHANGGGVPWLLLLKLALLGAGTVFAARRQFPWIWLLYALAGALFSGRIFGHYFLQAVVPFVLVVTPLLTSATLRRAVVLVVAGTAACVTGATLAGVALERIQGPSIFASRLQYYGNVARRAVGGLSPDDYRNRVDDHVSRNLKVVRILASLPPGSLLVWGNTPWLYPLSGRLPATQFTSAVRSPEVPGETAALQKALAKRVPSIVVVIHPAQPSLGPAAQTLRTYRLVGHVGSAVIYVR